jgi:hypothetical protein
LDVLIHYFQTIFSIETKDKIIQPEVWIHIGVTYDVSEKKANLYANGKIIQSDEGTGSLSQVCIISLYQSFRCVTSH